MGPEIVNNKVQFMESTAMEKYKEKIMEGKKCKNAKMHEHQNSIDNFYFLFSVLSRMITSAV